MKKLIKTAITSGDSIPEKGWIHMDGTIYKQAPDGHDDHCVLPVRVKEVETIE